MNERADTAPPHIPDFDLIRVIGEGGFGRVCLARNQTTGRLRAVKVIALQCVGRSNPAGREINSITRLENNLAGRHPNLLAIHHVGKTAENLFYVMDLADDADGAAASNDAAYRPSSLKSHLENGRISPDDCLQYSRQLLAGLAFLHHSGMVHRDVKPANCLFLQGELKLADFGLLAASGPQVSRVGTQTYMPPDGRMDARADVYATGLVIYEMLSGLPAESFPRLGKNAQATIANPIYDTLMRTVLRACEPDPGNRFCDAGQMLDDLESRISNTGVYRSRPSRRTAIIGTVAVAAALCLAVVAGFWTRRPQPVHVNFITRPFEATVWLDGKQQLDEHGTPYRTPCTIENLPPRVFQTQFRHDSLGQLNLGPQDFARRRRIEATWSVEP